MTLKYNLYRAYRVLQHPWALLLGRQARHRDQPLVWSFQRRARRLRRYLRRRLYGHETPATRPGAPCPRLHKPIFVVCTIRSGSSLLAACLDEHPDINYMGLELTTQWAQLGEFPISGPAGRDAYCPPLYERDALPCRRDNLHRGFAELVETRSDNPNGRFLNKSTHLWNKLPFLKALFPDAALIVVSRDVCSSAESIKRLSLRWYKTRNVRNYVHAELDYCLSMAPPMRLEGADPARIFPGGKLSVLAEHWLSVYRRIERDAALFDTVVPVWHRALVAHPRGTLNRIYTTLGLEPLDGPAPLDIDPARNDRWRERLSSVEQADLDAFTTANRSTIEALRLADTTL